MDSNSYGGETVFPPIPITPLKKYISAEKKVLFCFPCTPFLIYNNPMVLCTYKMYTVVHTPSVHKQYTFNIVYKSCPKEMIKEWTIYLLLINTYLQLEQYVPDKFQVISASNQQKKPWRDHIKTGH